MKKKKKKNINDFGARIGKKGMNVNKRRVETASKYQRKKIKETDIGQ